LRIQVVRGGGECDAKPMHGRRRKPKSGVSISVALATFGYTCNIGVAYNRSAIMIRNTDVA